MDKPEANLVLLPGLHGNGELYTDFMNALPPTFLSKALVFPNEVGLSYEHLLRVVQFSVEASRPFVLIAESFSTPLAIKFAATIPPNLKGLVLCAGFATSPVRGVTRILGRYLAPVLPFMPAGVAGAIMVSGSHAPHSILGRLRSAIDSVRPAVLVDRVRCVLARDVLDDLRRISVPVLYMQAAHDRLVNPVCLEEMRRVNPEIEVAVLNGAHVLLQLMPRQAAGVVADFVRRLRMME
jgi:pimeloyl-[acyl-carrier protein] methyl ester esterase